MSLTSRLRAVLGLDHSQFSRGLKGAEREAQGFGTRMKGVGGQLSAVLGVGIPAVTAASTIGFLRQTVRGIAEVGDEAKKSGLSMRAFQEWKFVAEQNRIGVDALVDGFKELSLRADEFVVTGGGSAADAFKRLGFSAAELKVKMKDPSALMLEIIGRLKTLDKAARIRVSDEIFGGAGGEQLLQILGMSEAELRAMIGRGHELGAVLDDEVIAKAAELDRKFSEVTTKIGNMFQTAVVGGFELAEAFANFRAEHEDLFRVLEAISPALAAIGLAANELETDGVRQAARDQEQLNEAYDLTYEAASALEAQLADLEGQLRRSNEAAAADAINALRLQVMDLGTEFITGKIEGEAFQAALSGLNAKAIETVDELGAIDGVSMEGVRKQVGLVATAISGALALARAFNAALPGSKGPSPAADAESYGQTSGSMNWWWNSKVESVLPPVAGFIQPDPKTKSTKGGGGGGAKQDDFARELDRTRERIAEWEAEAVVLASVATGNRALGDAMEFAKKKADLLTAAKKAGKAITPELEAEIDKLAEAYMTAGLNADQAADRLEQIRGASERGIDATSNLFGAILEGSDSARKAVAGLVAEIARVQMRKALLGAAGGSGGGVFSWLGGLIGSNSTGTPNWRGGLSRINELGGEIIDLPEGSRVYPADVSKRMADGAGAGSSGGGHLSIGFDQSTGSLTATMFDVAGRVIAQERSGIVGESVQTSARASRNGSKSIFGVR